MLEVDGVEVRFGDHVAVAGVSMVVERGEVVCLLGPSGSGKTSLLRAVAGLETPAAGAIRWDGRDVTREPTHRRGFGLVFQDFALFPHRSVAANVGFGLRMRGEPVEERVAEVLALVGLEGYGSRMPSTLSGGEQQRVALARAVAPGCELLLMDEPLGSLDRPLRERLTGELRAMLHDLGVAVVHVTHDQQEALAIADRVVVLRDGRVAQAGTPPEVWRRPADEFVARFLGFANLLPHPDGLLVVPPDAVSLGPEGEPGTVTAVTFRGTGFAVTVAVDGGASLEVPVRSEAIPAPGDRVRVAIEARLTSVVPVVR
ncbi:MAG TPA: ABC transporter ATP-binding protein [Acidimicrobiales bacterium]|nr:ABC transporter ATP-binding protein [Acidimicrobiales bacterium]